MAKNPCPSCGKEIASDRINVDEGVGFCNACQTLSRLSEIAQAGYGARQAATDDEILHPPPGCELDDRGHEIIVRASARSLPSIAGGIFVASFWNVGVSVFVLIAIAGLYTNITGRPIPSWFPAPPVGPQPNSIGAGMSLGMTLFLCVFLIPFVLIGTMMIGFVLHSLFGFNEVHLRGNEGAVRTTIGPFAWTRRFDAASVRRISMGQTTRPENGNSRPAIVVESDRVIRFGSGLREERREWMCRALCRLLVSPTQNVVKRRLQTD